MIIENNEHKSKRSLYIAIGSIVAILFMAIGFFIYFKSITKTDTIANDERVQISKVITNYGVGVKGYSTTNKENTEAKIENENANISTDDLIEGIKNKNKIISQRDDWYRLRSEHMNAHEQRKYYKEYSDIDEVIDEVISEDKAEEEDLADKITTIIKINTKTVKMKLDKAGKHDTVKITDKSAYNACLNSREEIDENHDEAPANDCGYSIEEDNEYMGDTYSARILGNTAYAFSDGTLNTMTGLDAFTYRDLSYNVSYWLLNYEWPSPFHWSITGETAYMNNAIVTGIWKTVDFDKINKDLIVLKEEDNKEQEDGYFRKYRAAFEIDNKWYEALLVEENYELKVWDIYYI